MAFDSLSEKLQNVFKNLRGKGRLTEADVKAALNQIEVNGITVSQVMGCGAQKGYSEIIRGSEVDLVLLPKVKFEIVVSSEEWEKKVIDAIREAAFTGEMGDGKIFSYEIRSATKIRTGETGYDALQSQA